MKPSDATGSTLDHVVSIRIDDDLFNYLKYVQSRTGVSIGTQIRTALQGMEMPDLPDKIDREDELEFLAATNMLERRLEHITFSPNFQRAADLLNTPIVDPAVVESLADIHETVRKIALRAH